MAEETRRTIDAAQVRRLIASQFPHLADFALVPIDGGWDHCSFRLGDAMTVRLPSAKHYAPQVLREHSWLPHIAPHLPMPIPKLIGLGQPGEDFPWHWAIQRWLPGEPLTMHAMQASKSAAAELGAFLQALQRITFTDAPLPSRDNFFRGAPVAMLTDDMEQAFARLGDHSGVKQARRMWEAALSARPAHRPVWLHGDVLAGNVLTDGTRISGVIDFGLMAVGDPAGDLMIAWSYFDRPAREALFQAIGADAALIERARGWALWKAAIIISGLTPRPPAEIAWAQAMFDAVMEA